ncbi:winged helix-turn-helix transcriptional regulator [Bacillus haikouensis]|uniref:ArsR/SmtB family transcription factor n=1 Tax=Bacillus haikouensis TaxID=1510468 RepID=UPI001554BBA6|nr:winged helix-turn-helix domain-containing protein [Bacillus haikouensis]NQD67432.1 winged helix-turn-helix transcriptional regulator [Bacillus haikouensis]
MNTSPNIASVAALISEPSRAAILTALLDGRLHPAGSLAYIAGISPQTTSFHLKKMVEADVIKVDKQGRHRYYGLKSHEVASVLETFLTIAPKIEMKSFKQVTRDKAVRYARTCYDHLAGSLGIKITDSLIRSGCIEEHEDTFVLTIQGEELFASLTIDLDAVVKKRRTYIHKCLDWSERRHHISGALGNALLEKFLELKWIRRVPDTRAIKITEVGKKELESVFRITV